MRKKRKLKKNVKIITLFLVVLATIITPFVFSKYTTTFKDKLIVYIRQPHYQVVFHSNNGSDPEVTTTQDFVYGTAENLDANTFTKTNYHFSKWTTNRDGTGTSYNDEEEVNKLTSVEGATIDLYAQWKEELVVTFSANGGTIPSGSAWDGSGSTVSKHINTATYGDLPTPTRNGYTFKGWKSRSDDHILPSDYQEVEYIESTGVQYINTGIIPSNTTGIYSRISSSNITSDLVYFGSRSTPNGRFWVGNNNSKIYFGWNDITTRSTYITSDTVNAIKMNYLNDRKAMFNDEVVRDIGSTSLISNTRPIYIFAGNDSGSTSYKSSIKLYEFQITDGNDIVRDYIPCYRISDETLGLYDLVNGGFYTNQGTGTFNKGNDIYVVTPSMQMITNEDHTLYAVWSYNPIVTINANGGTISSIEGWINSLDNTSATKRFEYNSNYGDLPTPTRTGYTFLGWRENNNLSLPSIYQEVEYIESTGTQYINTEYTITSDNVKFEGTAYMSKQSSESDLIGVTGDQNIAVGTGWSGYAWFAFSKGAGQASISSSTSVDAYMFNKKFDFEVKYNSTAPNKEITINNDSSTYASQSTANANFKNHVIQIFRSNTSYYFKGRLYGLKIYDSNNLVRDFVPCYRKSDNVIGLYDKVTGEFYTNAGTGTFNKGNNIENNYITSSTQVVTNEDHTLYAYWAKQINVNFDTKGGNSIDSKVFLKGDNYINLPTPTKSGYKFIGWSSSPDNRSNSKYIDVEYLEATGTQYILTDIIPKSDNKIVADVYLSSSASGTSEYAFMGARDSTTNRGMEYYFVKGVPLFWATHNSGYTLGNTTGSFFDQIIHYEASTTSSGMQFETSVTGNFSNSFVFDYGTSTRPYMIFAYNSKGTASYKFLGRIYSLQIYNNDSLTNNFIPSYGVTENAFGLYDSVNDNFYPNNGTGTFITGKSTLVDENTVITNDQDHTLYAVWEEE